MSIRWTDNRQIFRVKMLKHLTYEIDEEKYQRSQHAKIPSFFLDLPRIETPMACIQF